MKPFNLDEAKAGKPIIARDGRKAQFIAHTPQAIEEYRVVVFIEGNFGVTTTTEEGRFWSDGEESLGDIFMEEEVSFPKVRYVNIYLKGSVVRMSEFGYVSEDAAERARSSSTGVDSHIVEAGWEYVKTIEVTV